jgi:putative ABC transport system permease protein
MSLLTDIRQATRGLLRSPGFSCIAVLTLALAIGANTAIYSALRALVLDPLPFTDSNRLVFLCHKNPSMGGVMVTPPRKAIEQWRALSHVFESVESFTGQSFVITGGSEPEEVNASLSRRRPLRSFASCPGLAAASPMPIRSRVPLP